MARGRAAWWGYWIWRLGRSIGGKALPRSCWESRSASTARHGVAGVEALLAEENRNGVGLFQKLGLEQVEQGTVFRKEVS